MRLRAQTLGEYWDTAEEESKYYEIVDIPIPDDLWSEIKHEGLQTAESPTP